MITRILQALIYVQNSITMPHLVMIQLMRVIKWPRSHSHGICVNKKGRGYKGFYSIYIYMNSSSYMYVYGCLCGKNNQVKARNKSGVQIHLYLFLIKYTSYIYIFHIYQYRQTTIQNLNTIIYTFALKNIDTDQQFRGGWISIKQAILTLS